MASNDAQASRNLAHVIIITFLGLAPQPLYYSSMMQNSGSLTFGTGRRSLHSKSSEPN